MCLLDTATAFFCTSSLSKNVSFIEEREQWIFFEQNILGPDLPIYAFSQSILRQRRIFLLRQVRADGRGQAGIGPFITYGQKHCRRLRRHPNLFSLPSNNQASASLLLDHPSFSRQKWPFKAAAPSPPSPILSYPRPPLPSSRSTQLSPLQSVDAVRPSRPSTIKSLLQFSFFSWPRQGRHRHAHIGSRARPPTLFCLSSVDPPWPLDPHPQSAPQAICFCRLCLPCLALPRSLYHVYPVYTGAFSAFLRSIFPPPSCHYTTVECLYSGYRTHRSRQIRSLI